MFGILHVFNFEQPWNALAPIVVKPLFNSTVARLVQPLKAFAPKVLRLVGILTVCKYVLLLKALASIVSKLVQEVKSIVLTLELVDIDANAHSPIDFKDFGKVSLSS